MGARPRRNEAEATAAVAALNGQTVEENIFQSNRAVIADSKENYSPEQISTLQRVGV